MRVAPEPYYHKTVYPTWTSSSATIDDIEPFFKKSISGDKKYTRFTVSYLVNDREFTKTTEIPGGNPKFKVDEIIPIAVNPKNPNLYVFLFSDTLEGPIKLSMIGLALISLSSYLLLYKKSSKYF